MGHAGCGTAGCVGGLGRWRLAGMDMRRDGPRLECQDEKICMGTAEHVCQQNVKNLLLCVQRKVHGLWLPASAEAETRAHRQEEPAAKR